MAFIFDGPNKLIVLDAGTTSISVRDLYSRWKEWVATSDNSKFLQAFTSVGGDPIDVINGIYVTAYLFLQNGWRVRPQEADHSLNVNDGVLLTAEGDDPFVPPIGDYQVLVRYSQPVRTETVATNGGSGATPDQIAEAVWNRVVDGVLTAQQSLRLANAVLGGKTTGGGTGTEKFRDVGDTKDRIEATVDSNGNRLVIIRDLT